MVAIESSFEIPERDEIYLVSQRKYNLDPGRPWWQRLFFCYVFLPLNRFAFKYMSIAAPACMDSDGNIVLIEQQGVYTDEDAAKQICEDEFWQVKPLPFDVALPKESVQYKGHAYPRSVMPDRYRRRTFAVVSERTDHLEILQQSIAKLGKVVGT